MSEITSQSLREQVVDVLVGLYGWVPLDPEHHSAIAIKTYDTAVGPKQAHVYFNQESARSIATLSGDYWSEGRNVLESDTMLLDQNRPETLKANIGKFADRVHHSVSESYAVKLFRNKTINT